MVATGLKRWLLMQTARTFGRKSAYQVASTLFRRGFNERHVIACDASDNHIKISLYPKRYGTLRVVPEVMT
jgi:hypothetical protein